MALNSKMDILSVMRERPIIADGSYIYVFMKRGYATIGPCTPEVVLDHPTAVRELHREYMRAGADVIQAFTFFAREGRMNVNGKAYDTKELSQRACDLAAEVARPAGCFVCGGISPNPFYTEGRGKAVVQAEFRKEIDMLVKNEVDFYLAEYFAYVEEAEWALEILKETGKPVAISLRMGPRGEMGGASPQEVAVRLAKAGADIVGVNCLYDPDTCLKTIKMMKKGLEEAGLNPFLLVQPYGYVCPEVEDFYEGVMTLPEHPIAMEARKLTRFDARRFAREAFDLGVRYIGGCCGFESHHIAAMSDELKVERGFTAPDADKRVPFCEAMRSSDPDSSFLPFELRKTGRDYWMNVKPSFGRENNPRMATLDPESFIKESQHIIHKAD